MTHLVARSLETAAEPAAVYTQKSTVGKGMHHGRKPHLVGGIVQGRSHFWAEVVWREQAPEEDVGVQQKLQRLRPDSTASHAFSSTTGLTMSPRIRPVPSKQPSHEVGRSGGGGGTTWATGIPRRVTRMGLPVRLTRSRRARHVALNSGAFSCCPLERTYLMAWSVTMANSAGGPSGLRQDAGPRYSEGLLAEGSALRVPRGGEGSPPGARWTGCPGYRNGVEEAPQAEHARED
jgi:hypothetical protein